MRLIAALVAALCAPALAAHDGSAHALDWPSLLAASALALSAALYLAAIRAGAALSRAQVAAFAAGWGAIAIALLSPLDRAAGDSFALHMVQHELLMVVAPPLIILGRPFAALAATLPARAIALVALPLRLSPGVAWLLHALALWVWHVPRFFNVALASDGWHALQHASFFFTALLFWWAVFRRVRLGLAVLLVLTTMIHMGVLAALLTFAPAPLYGSTLDDQQAGGLVMWVPAGYAMLLAGLVAFDRFVGVRE